jgi:hypothetical protein
LEASTYFDPLETRNVRMRKQFWIPPLVLTFVGTMAAALGPGDDDDAALKRTRDEVKKLDALYKNAVVAVTDIYKTGAPAIKVGKRIFAAMEKDGWHSVRLVDATDNPLGDENEAKTDFEKRAKEKIRGGATYSEEVVTVGGKRHLLAATIVPAVHERCASCHNVKQGDLLGFLRYDLEVK